MNGTKIRVTEIDLLRFLAAISVVFFHYAFRGYAADNMSPIPYPTLAPVAKYGYLGVNLFFLVSGFVILMSASSGSLKKFIASRVARLYPAFWVCCTATFLVAIIIGGSAFSISTRQYLINLTMLSSFFGVPAVDGVYWSLLVEIKFYALVAVLLLAGKIDKVQPFLVAWLFAIVLLDAFPIAKLRSLLIIDYAPYFIAGATCFLIYIHGLSPARVAILVIAWMIALNHSLIELRHIENHYDTTIFNSYIVLSVVTIFFAVLFFVSTKRTGVVGRITWGTVGALTYPLYLVHQNVGFMVFNASDSSVDPYVLLVTTISVMLIFSAAVNKFVEQRFSLGLKRFVETMYGYGHRLVFPFIRDRVAKMRG